MPRSEMGIVLVLVVLVLLFQMINPIFLSQGNILAILRSVALPGLIAIGMMLCLVSGVIDLSVGATVGLSSVVFAFGSREQLGLGLCVLLSILVGMGAGLFNGWMVTRFNVTPFITTICTMYGIRGLASWISNGYAIYPLPQGWVQIGSSQPLGLSWAFFALLLGLFIIGWALDNTVWGLTLRATGSSKESAKCTEVNTDHVHISVFIASGVFASIAGVFLSLLMDAGIATGGTGWELTAIAACAIGGVSLQGYEGSPFGLFCGLLTLQVIQNGLVVIGVSPYVQPIAVGLILLIFMVIDVKRRRWLNLEQL